MDDSIDFIQPEDQQRYKDLRSQRTGKSFVATVVLADPGDGHVKFNLQFPQR